MFLPAVVGEASATARKARSAAGPSMLDRQLLVSFPAPFGFDWQLPLDLEGPPTHAWGFASSKVSSQTDSCLTAPLV